MPYVSSASSEDPDFMRQLPDELREWYDHHVSTHLTILVLLTAHIFHKFVPKWEDLYLASGTDTARVRKEGWKMQWLGVLPNYRSQDVYKVLVEPVTRKVSLCLKASDAC